jgi:hypothetical protein
VINHGITVTLTVGQRAFAALAYENHYSIAAQEERANRARQQNAHEGKGFADLTISADLHESQNPDEHTLNKLDEALQRKPGGNNNPNGIGGKSGKTIDPQIVNVDNVHSDNERPSGNSESAALRRLRKERPDLNTIANT